MSNVRRTIRKLETGPQTPLDEQLWPVNVALVVLGGFSIGTSLAYQRFDTPEWYNNALTYVVGVPLLIGAAMLACMSVNSHLWRRSMQLALVLSLLVHLFLMIASVEAVIFSKLMVETRSELKPTEQQSPTVKAEYNPHLVVPEDDDPRQDFEKPVETETPDPQPTPPLNRVDETQTATPVRPQPIPVPESQQTVQPSPVRHTRPDTATPREAAEPSKLSRQTRVNQLTPSINVAETPKASESSTAAAAQPQKLEITRQTTNAATARAEANAPAVQAVTNAAVAKKTIETATLPDANSAAQLKRQVNQPAMTPKSQIDAAEAPAIAKRTDPAELTPQNTSSIQRATTSVTQQHPERDVTPEAAVKPNAVVKRELDLAPQPTVAQSPASIAAKQERLTQRPSAEVAQPQAPGTRVANAEPSLAGPVAMSITRVEAKSVAEKAAAKEASLPNTADTNQLAARNTRTEAQPSPAAANEAASKASAVAAKANTNRSANVVTRAAPVEATSAPTQSPTLNASNSTALTARQNAANVPSATRTQATFEAPTTGAGTNTLAGGMTRATVSAQPSLQPEAAPAATPQRATRSATVAASPRNVESPSAQPGQQNAAPGAAEPARLALNRSQSGVAGSGNSPNLDRGVGAPDSPALVSSTSARRDSASSAGPPDAALTPSTLSSRAQSRASAITPSSSAKADLIASGSTGGANEVSDLVASSSAALQRATGNAAPGEVSAAKGSSNIDTGNTMIVAETGSGRASGGGQPELSFDPAQGTLSRQRSGAAPEASLAVDKIASTPAAPSGTGGGEPASLDPTQSLAVRGDKASGAAGGPSKATDTGALAEPSTASLLAEASVSRADAAGGNDSAAGTDDEDEEEKKKRLARAKAAQLAAGSATVSDIPVLVAGAGNSSGSLEVGSAAAANTATTRTASTGGAAAGGNLPSVGDILPETSGSGAVVAAIARADVGASASGPVTMAGGGTGNPTRAASGQTIASSAQAEMVAVAGAPASGGNSEGVNLQAQGIAQSKVSGGATAPIVAGPVGAMAGAEVVEALNVTNIGATGSGARQASPGTSDGPIVTAIVTSGTPGKADSKQGVVTDNAVAIAATGASTQAQAQADLDHGLETSKLTRYRASGGGFNVHLEAPEGSGGIGADLSREVGLNSRLARSDSPDLNASPSRFTGRRTAGVPAVSLAAVIPTDSFKQRAEGRRQGGSLPPQTETAIENGLAFLARYQQPDGSWRLQGMEANVADDPILVSDTAATAMALLAFQGAGYNHREHNYATAVRNGLDFIVRNQKENGDLFVPLDDSSNKSVWLYSHALATLALCEAYGMTQDPSLKDPAQKAVNFILAGQNKERGGWRYSPGVGTDTSVTGAMLVALRSAELSNLSVPKDCYEQVKKWMEAAQASPQEAHLYRYNPYAPDTEAQRHGRTPSATMTSLGLLMRLYLGWKRDNPHMVHGAEYLKANAPDMGSPTEMKRDTYYWYYATQVMYHMGGDHWQQWHDKLHKLLTTTQVKDGPLAGSWNPRAPLPDRWAAHGGRLYVTALNLLSLEVQYRHLPTYEDTAK